MTGSARSHDSCTHAKYRMTCQQYDHLHESASGRCQICNQIERYTSGRKLQIDHDKALGYWAVRGLLCISCNVSLGHECISGPEVDHYLSNPWYAHLPYAQQILPEEVDEGPTFDPETALDLVRKAADEAREAKRRQLKEWRGLFDSLRDMVRMAYRSGARQVDISAATRSVFSPDQVYAIVKERRRQPAIPTE